MADKKSSIVKNTLVMLVVTFICVALLAVVNQVTRGPIEKAEINARAEVYKVVYPDADAFTEIDGVDEMIEGSGDMLAEAGFNGCYVKDALAVADANGDVVGYVIASVSPSGYGGDVQIAVGITKDGVITGFDVISNSETAGLGSRCTEPEFKAQFTGKPATKLEYTKTGATEDNQIDAISGATITTNAVTEAVNSAIVFYLTNFTDGTQEFETPDSSDTADVNDADAIAGATAEDTNDDNSETTSEEASDAQSGATVDTDNGSHSGNGKGKGGKS